MVNDFFMEQTLATYKNYLLKEKKYSLHTTIAYVNDVASFFDFYKEDDLSVVDIDLKHIDYSAIRAWVSFLSSEGMVNKTINRKISSLKSFFKYLYVSKQVDEYLFVVHKSLKNEKTIQVPFSEKEIEALHLESFSENFEGKRDRLILELLYSLGIRRAELIGLKMCDVDFGNNTLKVTGKRNKQRIVPMVDTVVELIKQYLVVRNERYGDVKDVLILTNNGNILNETFVYRLINNYFRGVTSKAKKSPHMLRHTFATHMLNNGADLNSIKELLGHSSLASTQIYVHSSLSELKNVYKNAHPRFRKDGE